MDEKKMNDKNEMEIDLIEVLSILKKHLFAILIVALLFSGVGAVYCFFVASPVYQSTAKIYVMPQQNQNDGAMYSDLQAGTSMTKDYIELIQSRSVVETVIRTMNLDYNYDELREMMTVESPQDTRIVAISVNDTDRQEAKAIANALAVTAVTKIANIMNTDEPTITDRAVAESDPIAPQKAKILAIAFILGFILMSIFFIIRELRDDTIKTADDIEEYLGLSVLAQIPIAEGQQASTKKNRRERRKNIRQQRRQHAAASEQIKKGR